MKNLALVVTMGLSFQAFAAIDSTYFATLDVKSIHDQEKANEKKGEAPRFAIPHSVSISPMKSQNWEKSAQGYTWTHRVTTPNAVSLNFGFSSFELPEGAELNIYSADRTQFIRPFTAAYNNVNGQLWTPVIMSDDVIIELTVPANAVDSVKLELTQVGQGFRTFGQSTAKSGSCNIDVACDDSKGWEAEVNSVGVISTGGSSFCTGFMINNTNNDKTPFFMTAAHCRITAQTAPTLVVYWNYQASKCGGSRDGRMTDFQSGSVHLATNSKSDATLVKMNTAPKAAWNVNFAGWDATTAIGTAAVGIHHPNVDEKSISFENEATVLASYGGDSSPGDSTHVRIVDWDKGTTEPGSSGSPLFDSNHRVIGQLHGGGAACGNDLSDYYGRFHTSYKEANFKKFLDSANTGKLTVDTI